MGRPLLSEDEVPFIWQRPDCAQRRRVLQETLHAFEVDPARPLRAALANLGRWRGQQSAADPIGEVLVFPGDWGEVTLALTQRYGACFAVLNMANAHVPGGAYVEGAPAQEENMYRRTDCHFFIGPPDYDPAHDRYQPHMTALLEAAEGRVYLDVARPRVCLRGPEDRHRPDLGYPWLADAEIFPFFELRAAAPDLRDGSAYDPVEMRRRIRAQLTTLQEAGLRHVVLSAFGCGAFRNPAHEVASAYAAVLQEVRQHFSVVAFAIFHPGYGPDNFTPFAHVLSTAGTG